jgi:hypothetical protein
MTTIHIDLTISRHGMKFFTEDTYVDPDASLTIQNFGERFPSLNSVQVMISSWFFESGHEQHLATAREDLQTSQLFKVAQELEVLSLVPGLEP